MAQAIAPRALPIIPSRYFLFKLDLTGVILSLSFSSGHSVFSMQAISFIGIFITCVWIGSNKTRNAGGPRFECQFELDRADGSSYSLSRTWILRDIAS
jgi:hypothetical protein